LTKAVICNTLVLSFRVGSLEKAGQNSFTMERYGKWKMMAKTLILRRKRHLLLPSTIVRGGRS
jgi:hypothetical protein